MNKITKIIVGAVILALVVWGGVKLLGTKEEKTTETIKIGAIYGLTGPLAGLGEMFKNGAVFATDDINNSGGIKGRKLSLLIEDGQSDVKNSVSAFQKLVDIEGVKYIDSFGSAINLALKPLAEEKKVILLANSSHPKITEGVKFILRHSNIASSDAKILIDEVKKKSPSKVGIIYLNDDWGVVFNKKFQQMLRDSNPLIEIISESHLPKDTDMRTQILKILSGKPDLVLIASFGPASGIIVKQLKEMNYSGDIFMNIGFALSPDAQKIAGDAANGIYYQTMKKYSRFEEDYFKKYNKESGSFSVYAYTNFELLKYAIENVGYDTEKISDFIKNLKEFNGKYEYLIINDNGDMILETIVSRWGR